MKLAILMGGLTTALAKSTKQTAVDATAHPAFKKVAQCDGAGLTISSAAHFGNITS